MSSMTDIEQLKAEIASMAKRLLFEFEVTLSKEEATGRWAVLIQRSPDVFVVERDLTYRQALSRREGVRQAFLAGVKMADQLRTRAPLTCRLLRGWPFSDE